jgi:riboflavin biosynthesis pyrimidine reductase
MSDTSTATGKVVVNRAMSLDGFIAGPGHAMDWIAGALAPDKIREQAAATGAMLIGRRTAEVGDRMEAEEPGSVDYLLGADVAGQCLRRGLVDESLVYVLPVLLGDGIRFSPPGLPRIDLEPVSSTRSGAVTILLFRVRK